LECGARDKGTGTVSIDVICSRPLNLWDSVDKFLQFLQSSMLAWMVDLLRCAGQLQEAEDVINMMPFEPQVLLHCLSAFRIHGNVEMGGRIEK